MPGKRNKVERFYLLEVENLFVRAKRNQLSAFRAGKTHSKVPMISWLRRPFPTVLSYEGMHGAIRELV